MKMQEATYTQLKENIEVSDPTLSSYIRELTKRRLIEWSETADRREKGYRIKSKTKASSELQRYTSIEFIGNMKDIICASRPSRDRKTTLNVFLSPVEEQERAPMKKRADKIMRRYIWLLRWIGTRLFPGNKMAIVITVEG